MTKVERRALNEKLLTVLRGVLIARGALFINSTDDDTMSGLANLNHSLRLLIEIMHELDT